MVNGNWELGNGNWEWVRRDWEWEIADGDRQAGAGNGESDIFDSQVCRAFLWREIRRKSFHKQSNCYVANCVLFLQERERKWSVETHRFPFQIFPFFHI